MIRPGSPVTLSAPALLNAPWIQRFSACPRHEPVFSIANLVDERPRVLQSLLAGFNLLQTSSMMTPVVTPMSPMMSAPVTMVPTPMPVMTVAKEMAKTESERHTRTDRFHIGHHRLLHVDGRRLRIHYCRCRRGS